MRQNMRTLAVTAIAAAVSALPGIAAAQAWPTKAVRIINPFPAGGGTDAFARPLAAKLSKDLGKNFFIENLGGAGGTLGAGVAARASGDGYTWFMGAVHHTIAETLYRKLSYNLIRDFVPVTVAAYVPNVIVVHPTIPVKSVKELIALDKKNPGKINFGSAGYGTTHHMVGELFKLQTGTKLVHVPYKGAGPLTADLLAGHVDMAFDGMATSAPNIKAGRVRALAVTSAKRAEVVPDVPTMQEVGFKDFAVTTWYGMWGVKGVPAAAVNRMHEGMVKAMALPDMKELWSRLGGTAGGQSPAEFDKFVKSEVETWGKVVKSSGAKVEN
jgi:tripartite-type tricarboxylate transporter receptor subunit TctC